MMIHSVPVVLFRRNMAFLVGKLRTRENLSIPLCRDLERLVRTGARMVTCSTLVPTLCFAVALGG